MSSETLKHVRHVLSENPVTMAAAALFLCSDGASDALRPDGQRVGRDRIDATIRRRFLSQGTPAMALHGRLDHGCQRLGDGLHHRGRRTLAGIPAGHDPGADVFHLCGGACCLWTRWRSCASHVA